MEAIKAKIKTNLAFSHYLAYCASFIGYGCVITGLGPLIPYFSALTGLAQTQYSYLFFCRSAGFITGAILLRFLEKYLNYHSIMIMSSVVLVFLLGGFSFFLDFTIQGIMMFLISTFCCFLQVMVNVCVLQTQKNGDIEFWMLICHGVFGIGGLIGPLLVYVFELYSFLVMGIMIICIAPFYYILETPEDHLKVKQQIKRHSITQQMKHAGYEGQSPLPENKNTSKIVIGKQIQYLICFMFLIYIGLESSYGSWICSYAVLQKIATKQEATRFTSIFWISMTVFRFVSSCLPYKSMKKLYILGYSLIAYLLVSMVLLYSNQKKLACYFSSIAFGMSLSSMFPLLLSIPTQYGLSVTAQQNANFMVWASLGEGILSMLIGYLMALVFNDMLFYMIFVMAVVFLICSHVIQGYYIRQSKENQSGLKQTLKYNEMEMENF